MNEDDQLSPQESLELIRSQRQAEAKSRMAYESGILATWGIAWLVGYGAVWLSYKEILPFELPLWAGLVILFVLLGIAGVVTVVYLVQQERGVRGTRSWQGAVWGICWALSFTFMGSFGGALERFGAGDDSVHLYYAVMPAALVGIMYIAGAALWVDRSMLVMGLCVLVAAYAAMWFGPVNCNAVLSLLGGGSLIVGALAMRRIELRRLAREAL